jgi:tripartite-type tricarboxylate transporter receptor subunit TctC
MKKFLLSVLLSLGIVSYVSASQPSCGVVINFPPGGTSDSYARLLQKTNPAWKVEYQVGSFAAKAILFLEKNTSYVYFGSPVMFGKNSPDKNPPVELYRILIGAPILTITNKNITIDDLNDRKLNIGVPSFGTAHHMIALQLKEQNPDIEIISTGGDNKALPMIMNGDLDLYLVSKPAGLKFLTDFESLTNLIEFKFGTPTKINGVLIKSQGFNGLFIHKNATKEQREFIDQCVNKSLKDPVWAETLLNQGVDPLDITGENKDAALNEYIDNLKKYGL